MKPLRSALTPLEWALGFAVALAFGAICLVLVVWDWAMGADSQNRL